MAQAIPRLLVTTSVDSGVATLRINRPQLRNTLNPATMYQLHQAVLESAADPVVQGIVITGEGKSFVMGADVGYFIRAIEQNAVQRIVDFTVAGFACFDAIQHCPKPVVAAINGPAFGGGLELAMACRYRLAVPSASLALPETGLGIYPGWGGVFRSARLLGEGIAKWLVYTGKTVSAKDALALGLIDQTTTPDALESLAQQVARGQSLAAPDRGQPSIERSLWERFFTAHSIDQILADNADAYGNSLLAKVPAQIAAKGPLGLRCAEQLFAEADSLTDEERLESNLKLTWEIYHTHDAHLGLTWLQEGRIGRVPFTGK